MSSRGNVLDRVLDPLYVEAGTDLLAHRSIGTAVTEAFRRLPPHHRAHGQVIHIQGSPLPEQRWEDTGARYAAAIFTLADLGIAQCNDIINWHPLGERFASRVIHLCDLIRSMKLPPEQLEPLEQSHLDVPDWNIHNSHLEERETVADFTRWLRSCTPATRHEAHNRMAGLADSDIPFTLTSNGGVGGCRSYEERLAS